MDGEIAYNLSSGENVYFLREGKKKVKYGIWILVSLQLVYILTHNSQNAGKK